jgi:F-type H+-transporting ATPase subunit epsilon
LELGKKDFVSMFDVIIYSPEKQIFQGKASSVLFPGETGVFEILSYHKPLLSRLIGGNIVVDDKTFKIRCGIVGVSHNKATVVIEE